MSPDSDNKAANLTVLTNEQFHKLLEAVGGRGLIPSLHKLTDEQKKAEKAFNLAGSQMGLGTFVKLPERVTRTDRFLAAPVPRHAAQARVFLQTGVIQVPVDVGDAGFYLPDGVRHSNRVGRIEFLDANGATISVTGGEQPPPKRHDDDDDDDDSKRNRAS